MDALGKPVGGDDHGSGLGLSGGHGEPNAQNTQAGMIAAAQEKSGFNAGIGGQHASGGLPGHNSGSTEAHPIADKFMSGSTGGKFDNSLDNFGGNSGVAAGAGAAGLTNAGASRGQGDSAVSGAYEGGGAQDALTGQSRAFETSEGVGYGGENLSQKVGLGDGAGAAGSRDDRALGAGSYGTGVGAQGGAGGHYDPETAGSGKAGIGAGAAGLGAAGAGGAALAGSGESTNSSGSNKQGHYGTTETDFDRGAPLSDPKQMDTGGPHSLVLDPATGKYIHRHEKEGGALADEQQRPE